jgi:hypothetical protein
MRKDSANNKSNYSEKEPPNSDSRWRRFTLERVFGEEMSRTFFYLRRKTCSSTALNSSRDKSSEDFLIGSS